MLKGKQLHKLFWSFTENNTIISFDVCRLTISLSSGSNPHQDAMELTESFDEFLESNSPLKNYINNYVYLNQHANEILAAVNYYNSDDYLNTVSWDEFLNFKKYNPEKAKYISDKFPQYRDFTAQVQSIKNVNKRSVKAYIIFSSILLVIPLIWSFYSYKALYILVPCFLFCLLIIRFIVKVNKYEPKYAEAEVMEVYQGKSTAPSKNLTTPVYVVKVKAHRLFAFKNGYIDMNAYEDVAAKSYQISSTDFKQVNNQTSIRFLTRGSDEIFEVIL